MTFVADWWQAPARQLQACSHCAGISGRCEQHLLRRRAFPDQCRPPSRAGESHCSFMPVLICSSLHATAILSVACLCAPARMCACAATTDADALCRQCGTHSSQAAAHHKDIEQMMQPRMLSMPAAGVWVLLHAGWVPAMDAAVCGDVPHGPAAGRQSIASQDAICKVRRDHAEKWSLAPLRISITLPSAVYLTATAAAADAGGAAAMNEMSMHTMMCQACWPWSVI